MDHNVHLAPPLPPRHTNSSPRLPPDLPPRSIHNHPVPDHTQAPPKPPTDPTSHNSALGPDDHARTTPLPTPLIPPQHLSLLPGSPSPYKSDNPIHPPPKHPSAHPSAHPPAHPAPASPPTSDYAPSPSISKFSPVSQSKVSLAATDESIPELSLSERELRDVYDDEEIDRFLRLFSAHVHEVKLRDSSIPRVDVGPSHNDDASVLSLDQSEVTEEGDWVSWEQPPVLSEAPTIQPQCLSELIATKYLIPVLPPSSSSIQPFTFSRFQLTAQRLYLALAPAYQFIFFRLLRLALWEDKNHSLKYYAAFWALWLNDLLLPSFFFYLLCIHWHRKMFPYPSLQELREHRDRVDRAGHFGEELQMRTMNSPTFGVGDAWKIFRAINKPLTSKHKSKSSDKGKEKDFDEPEESIEHVDRAELLEQPLSNLSENDLKALGLELLVQITDGLERLKNLFLWRRPNCSYAFGIMLGAAFLFTFLVPAAYLAKMTYFCLGVAFWHVPPVIAAVPAADRRRILHLLDPIPTDADYAMDLIARRVEAGQKIMPLKRRKHFEGTCTTVGEDTTDDAEGNLELIAKKGFKSGVVGIKSLANRGLKMVGGDQFLRKAFTPGEVRQATETGGSRAYPAQYGKSPGVITLTSDALYFSVPMTSSAKITIPLDDIVGLKKELKGISFRVRNNPHEEEPAIVKFALVYERDELFARLVGLGGGRWLKV